MSDATVSAKKKVLVDKISSSDAEIARLRGDETDVKDAIGESLAEKYVPGREATVKAQTVQLSDVQRMIASAQNEKASVESQLAQLQQHGNGNGASSNTPINNAANSITAGLSSLLNFGQSGFSTPSLQLG